MNSLLMKRSPSVSFTFGETAGVYFTQRTGSGFGSFGVVYKARVSTFYVGTRVSVSGRSHSSMLVRKPASHHILASFENTNRSYSFDTRGNRTNKTVQNFTNNGGVCNATTTTSRNLTFNLQSEISSSGYVYDELGRNTTISGVDAPNGGSNITVGYGADDRIVSLSQSGVTTSYTYDALGRRINETTGTTTNVRHYSDSSDNPSWVTGTGSAANQTDVYTPSLGGGLAATKTTIGTTTTKYLAVTNLHGDVLTNLTLPATGDVAPATQINGFDEYGVATNTATPNTRNLFVIGYGSLGQQGRATTDCGITLMGARGYNPATGQFLSVDPIPGGNENDYNYPNDPINQSDLQGKSTDDWIKLGISALAAAITVAGCAATAGIGCLVVGVVVGAVAGGISAGVISGRHHRPKKERLNAILEGMGIGAFTGLLGGGLNKGLLTLFKMTTAKESRKLIFEVIASVHLDRTVDGAVAEFKNHFGIK